MKLTTLAIVALVITPPLATQVGGCATVQQILSQPTDARTLATALRLATTATRAVDIAVKNADLDIPTLEQMKKLNDGVHAALVSLQADQQAGKPLVFASFNAAMDAFAAYANSKGIAVATS